MFCSLKITKKGWIGCKVFFLCDSHESINHLFISCSFARSVCRVVPFTFNISPPANITNMFGNYLTGIDKRVKARIRI
jgi:hypothetical protein